MTLAELKKFFPDASLSTILRNAGVEPVRPPEPERNQGGALDSPTKRKAKGSLGAQARYRIAFTVFRVRPLDWDNHFTKPLQDALVRAGFLPDDNWRVLEGSCRSCKAASKDEERTEILIERIA